MFMFNTPRICYLVTLWIALPLLSRRAGLHDATVATVACVTGAAGLTLPESKVQFPGAFLNF